MSEAIAQINKVLQKLQKDSSKKHSKLRDVLKIALDNIKDFTLQGDESNLATHPQWDKFMNSVVNVFKSAIETRSHKQMARCIDCFMMLLSRGLLKGSIVDEETPSRPLLEKVMECIRLCADTSDESLLVSVAKAIQAASATPACGLHGNALIIAFKTIYRIHLHSKVQTGVHSLSKATLSHVLNGPFRVLRTTQSITKYKSALDASSVGIPPPVAEGDDVEISQNDVELEDSATTFSDDTEGDFSALEAPKESPVVDPFAISPSPSKHISPSEGGDEMVALNDCLLLFNLLCKISATESERESGREETMENKNKALSLELLLSVLESSGPSFRNYDKFIHQGLREHLSVALLVNGTSAHPKIYKLVLSIFLHVLSYFRDFMKDEIEDFMTKVLLRPLEITSTMQQRWMSLQVVHQICKNPQTLLDIFINYDCDLDMKDIFERMVNDLSKVSQGNFQTEHKTSPLQDSQVKLLALEAIVVLLHSMVDWSHPLYEESQKMCFQSAQGEDPADYSEEGGQQAATPAVMKELIQQADQFSKQKQFKLTVEKGKPKFAISAKKGVQYFLSIGAIKHQADEIALFFRNTSGLDKARIGEYLGEKDQFNLDVMQCYVNLFNFAKCEIDIALRQFLSGFRLPGEAQKIDRIMEKFAQRYYLTNADTGVFASAESAYILAFAIVMLATDLHSNQIKKHMTKEEWLKMNKGNNAKANWEDSYLLGIYDRIAAERLKLTAEGDGSDESRDFTPKSNEGRVYHSARSISHVKSMFSTAWHAILAAFSVLLDQSEDQRTVSLILTGIKHAVRVSGIFSMDLERSAFIKSFSKFTVLDSLREMKQKHIDSILCLLTIAQTDGNYIMDSWTPVQRCISGLDRLHVYGITPSIDDPRVSDRERSSRTFLRNQKNDGFALELVAHQIDSSVIDKLYANSNLLSSSALLSLIKSLCEVSAEEVSTSPPSLFSVQKLVDIIYLNLLRPRPVWIKSWHLVADHFCRVGTTDNLQTSLFAIDALYRLVTKVLEQEDLSTYHFQKELVRSFDYVFSKNTAKEVQESIIQSFTQIILARSQNIQSGWKSVFNVCTAAALAEGTIMCLAFELIEEVVKEYFHCIADTFFVDCVNSLNTYANNKSNRDISLRAIDALSFCAVQLANGRVCPLSREDTAPTLFTDNEKHMSLWFPLLTGLARVVGHHYEDLRAGALDNLFRVLILFGSTFSAKLWELIFRGVLLPIFDSIGYSKGKAEVINADNPWLTTTCAPAFRQMAEMYVNFIEIIDFLLEDMMDLFVSCMLQDNEYLARISCGSMVSMITTIGAKFTPEMWTLICDHLLRACQSNVPLEIIELSSKPPVNPTRLRNSDSTGFNSLPSRLGLSTHSFSNPSTPVSFSTPSIPNVFATPLASSTASSVSTPTSPISSSPPSPSTIPHASPISLPPAHLLSFPTPTPTPSTPTIAIPSSLPSTPDEKENSAPRRRSSTSASQISHFNLLREALAASPPPPPSSSLSSPQSSAPQGKRRLPSPRTSFLAPSSSSELAPSPDTSSRRRAASVAGSAPTPSFHSPPPVPHSSSVPEIQKIDIPLRSISTPSPSTRASPHTSPHTPSTSPSPSTPPNSHSFLNLPHSVSATSSTPPPNPPPSKKGTSFLSSLASVASPPPSHSHPPPPQPDLSSPPGGTSSQKTASFGKLPTPKLDAVGKARSKCIVQLLLIHAVDDIALSQYDRLSTDHLVSFVECQEVSYLFSHKINKDRTIADFLLRSGVCDLLKKQEINSISSYLTILFRLYGEVKVDVENRVIKSEERLIERCKTILTEFVDELDATNKIPIIIQILKSLLNLEETQFCKNSRIFYTVLTDLMLTDSRDIRVVLRDIMVRLGEIKNLAQED